MRENIARQLPVPVEDSQVEKAVEVIRVWVADGELYFSIFPIWKIILKFGAAYLQIQRVM